MVDGKSRHQGEAGRQASKVFDENDGANQTSSGLGKVIASATARGGREAKFKTSSENTPIYLKWTGAGINLVQHKFRTTRSTCECSHHAPPAPMRNARVQGLVKPTPHRCPSARFFLTNTTPFVIAEDGGNPEMSLPPRFIGISQTTFLQQA
jgi:hypothetical protein